MQACRTYEEDGSFFSIMKLREFTDKYNVVPVKEMSMFRGLYPRIVIRVMPAGCSAWPLRTKMKVVDILRRQTGRRRLCRH